MKPPDRILSGIEYKQAKQELIYAWKRGEEYLYIGATGSGFSRFLYHQVIGRWEEILDTDEIFVWFTKQAFKIEVEMIKLYNPKYNRNVVLEQGIEIKCIICGKKFITKRKWQKYCSRRCANVRG